MKKGILHFHQGWTDIINCLSLINYYLEKYEEIILITRQDSKPIIDFYVKNIDKIVLLYVNKHSLDTENFDVILSSNGINYNEYDLLFIGWWDMYRNDIYKENFNTFVYSKGIDFCESFYSAYDIPYITRVEKFSIERDYSLEQEKYNNFIEKYGKKYILNHEIPLEQSLCKNEENISYINLNGMSDIFFDCIAILENAEEFHLLDSVWGAIIYHLDAKYGLFKNKKIYLYIKRGYKRMFTEPITLENWIIVG